MIKDHLSVEMESNSDEKFVQSLCSTGNRLIIFFDVTRKAVNLGNGIQLPCQIRIPCTNASSSLNKFLHNLLSNSRSI